MTKSLRFPFLPQHKLHHLNTLTDELFERILNLYHIITIQKQHGVPIKRIKLDYIIKDIENVSARAARALSLFSAVHPLQPLARIASV
jgi:hypothetical protein